MGGLLGVVGHGRPLGHQARPGHGAGRRGRLGQVPRPGQHADRVQPLDAEGKALQLMRSWMTAMPGEVVSCVGCHEQQNTAPPVKRDAGPGPAARRDRALVRPDARVQLSPARCSRCSTATASAATTAGRGPTARQIADLRGDREDHRLEARSPPATAATAAASSPSATPSCTATSAGPASRATSTCSSRWSSTPTPPSWCRCSSKGHHGVELDAEAWDRLITWIDLNCPYHGTWGEDVGDPGRAARSAAASCCKLYANVDDDPEAVPEPSRVDRARRADRARAAAAAGAAGGRRAPTGRSTRPRRSDASRRRPARRRRTVDLGDGVTMELVLIPAGEFVMGSRRRRSRRTAAGTRARSTEPFWMGRAK